MHRITLTDDSQKGFARYCPTLAQGYSYIAVRIEIFKLKIKKLISLGRSDEIRGSSVPALIHILKCGDQRMKREAALVLGEIGDRSAVPALIKALEDEDNEIRAVAAWSLERIGDASAVPALIGALRDKVRDVSDHAELALEEIFGKNAVWVLGKKDTTVTPTLILALKDKDEKVRGFAAMGLGKIGEKDPGKVNLEAVQESFREFVIGSKDNVKARKEAAELYSQISEAVSKGRKRIDMPGEGLEPRIMKKPKVFRGGISRVC